MALSSQLLGPYLHFQIPSFPEGGAVRCEVCLLASQASETTSLGRFWLVLSPISAAATAEGAE